MSIPRRVVRHDQRSLDRLFDLATRRITAQNHVMPEITDGNDRAKEECAEGPEKRLIFQLRSKKRSDYVRKIRQAEPSQLA